ncbi:MAG: hypothetical protein PHF70_11635 [Opitutales bacterium]|nr:hypothetical protein [Opitutales bacterium]
MSPVAECVSIPEQRDPEVTRGDGTGTADKDGTLTRPATMEIEEWASRMLPLLLEEAATRGRHGMDEGGTKKGSGKPEPMRLCQD